MVSGISALQTQTHPVCFEEEEQPQKPREAKRSDLPVCWLDDTQHIKEIFIFIFFSQRPQLID